jgi:hypothetical protein
MNSMQMLDYFQRWCILKHQVVGYSETTTGSNPVITFDPTAMRWWRFRGSADLVHPVIYIDTSPDGDAWTVRNSVTSSFALSPFSVIMTAGYFPATSSFNTVSFDNLNFHDSIVVTSGVSVSSSIGSVLAIAGVVASGVIGTVVVQAGALTQQSGVVASKCYWYVGNFRKCNTHTDWCICDLYVGYASC